MILMNKTADTSRNCDTVDNLSEDIMEGGDQ